MVSEPKVVDSFFNNLLYLNSVGALVWWCGIVYTKKVLSKEIEFYMGPFWPFQSFLWTFLMGIIHFLKLFTKLRDREKYQLTFLMGIITLSVSQR